MVTGESVDEQTAKAMVENVTQLAEWARAGRMEQVAYVVLLRPDVEDPHGRILQWASSDSAELIGHTHMLVRWMESGWRTEEKPEPPRAEDGVAEDGSPDATEAVRR